MENKKTFGAYVLQRRRGTGNDPEGTGREIICDRVCRQQVGERTQLPGYYDPAESLCRLQVTEHELLTGSEDTSRKVSEKLAQKYKKLTRIIGSFNMYFME